MKETKDIIASLYALRLCAGDVMPDHCAGCHANEEGYCVNGLVREIAEFIENLQTQLAESQRREKAAVEELHRAAPCFACTHFERNKEGGCVGAGRCRYAEPEMSRYPDRFDWRGPSEEKGADPS